MMQCLSSNLMRFKTLNDKLLSSRGTLAFLHGGVGLDSGGGGGGRACRRGWAPEDGQEGPGGKGIAWAAVSLISMLSMTALPASAASDKGQDKTKVLYMDKPEQSIESVTDLMWQMASPVLTNLGFSGVMGCAAGYAAKRVGQMLAVLVGLAFAAIQGLAYTGAISVNWSHIEGMVHRAFDLNGDGKLDERDFKLISSKGLSLLSQGVPSIGGFLTGFLLALRY